MNMPEVEERLGRLEVQMDRVEEDVREIKTKLDGLAIEMRDHAGTLTDRFHGLELSLRDGGSATPNGNGNSGPLAMAIALGKHVDKAGKWVIIGILAYFLKIITIDVDLPRLNKFVGTYESLSKAGAVELPTSPASPVR